MTSRSTPERGRRCGGDVPHLKMRRTTSGATVTYAYFNGRQVSFGPAGPESQRAYDDHVAQWLANSRANSDDSHCENTNDHCNWTVADIIALYLEHAEREYDKRELQQFRQAFRPLLALFHSLPVVQFTAARLTELQHYLANTEFHQSRKNKPPRSYRLSRATISTRIGYIRRCWRWAEAEGLTPEGRWHSLRTVAAIRPGRTQAKEPKPLGAVEWSRVEPVLAHLTPTLADVVRILWHSGARPAEILSMTGRQLDRSGELWLYRPTQHKGRWRGRERVIPLSKAAQDVLTPRLHLDPDRAVFSPCDALREIKDRKRAARQTPMTPSQRQRDEQNASRQSPVGEFYASNELSKAVRRACRAADIEPWTPYDLRRAAAVRLFEAGDAEGARALLGHTALAMSRHYAQKADQHLAENAARRLGLIEG
jgi:integrase